MECLHPYNRASGQRPWGEILHPKPSARELRSEANKLTFSPICWPRGEGLGVKASERRSFKPKRSFLSTPVNRRSRRFTGIERRTPQIPNQPPKHSYSDFVPHFRQDGQDGRLAAFAAGQAHGRTHPQLHQPTAVTSNPRKPNL